MTNAKAKTELTNAQSAAVTGMGQDLASIVNAGHTARGCWAALSATLSKAFPGKRWGVAPSRLQGMLDRGDMPKSQAMSKTQYGRLSLLLDAARSAAIAVLLEEHGEDEGKTLAAEMPDSATIRSRAYQHSPFMAERTKEKNARNNAKKKAASAKGKTETETETESTPPTVEGISTLLGNAIPMVTYIDRRTRDKVVKGRLAVAMEHIKEAIEALESK